MIATKVLTSARLDSDRVKTLAKIAQKLNISKNAVIENALDLYAEAILGVTVANAINNDISNAINEDRLKAVEHTLSELQANLTSNTSSDNITEKMSKMISKLESRLAKLEASTKATKAQPKDQPKEQPKPTETIAETIAKATEAIDDTIFDNLDTEPTEAIEPTIDIFDIPTEAITDCNQKLALTREDFKTKFNLTEDRYHRVGNMGHQPKGWSAEDGSTWFFYGAPKAKLWHNYPATLVEA